MNLKTVSIAIFLFPSIGLGQSAITAGGGDGTGTGGSVAFSLGQVACSEANGNGGFIQEGVQQAYELSPVEVPEALAAIELSFFPNPTSGQLTIQLHSFAENTSISIFDVSGSLVHALPLTSPITRVDASGWPSGIYFIELTTVNLLRSRYKLVKA